MSATDLQNIGSVDVLREHIKQVMQIHQIMFDKLITDKVYLPIELNEFSGDAGDIYLQFSEIISEQHCRVSQVKQHLNAAAIFVGGAVIESELIAEPRIFGEEIAEPIEDQPYRPGVKPLG